MTPDTTAQSGKERAVAFIVARLSSSRFPGKQFQKIGSRRLIDWTIANLQQCRELDEIVIATVAENANRPLREFADQNQIPCFWYEGEVDHVTTRLRKAAEHYGADICLLVSGDCPLVYGPAIDFLVQQFRMDRNADRLQVLPDENGLPDAVEGVQIARRRAWQLADDLSDQPELKEHQFPIMSKRSELFKTMACRLPQELYAPHHRFSIDTWADLEFMNTLFNRLATAGRNFSLPEVLNLLREAPELRQINAHVYQRKLVEEIKKVLVVADAGGRFAYGHLMRCLELALQLTERLSWPVTFMVDDEHAADLLRQHGLKVLWGAFARPATQTPDSHQSVELKKIIPTFDLLILDIFDLRGPDSGWRQQLQSNVPIAVIDNILNWAAEADLLIIHGITKDCPWPTGTRAPGQSQPVECISGTDTIIIRREIRQVASSPTTKDIDILVYLHDIKEQQAAEKWLARHNIAGMVLGAFTPDFPNLLARSRIFLSGFGCSFYEALALGTFPVCWPDSPAHDQDAIRFYQRFQLPELIIRATGELETKLLQFLASQVPPVELLKDGTPNIIRKLESLARNKTITQTTPH